VKLLVVALDVLLVAFLELLQVVEGLVSGQVVARRHPSLMDHVLEVEYRSGLGLRCNLRDRLALQPVDIGLDLVCDHLVLERRCYRPFEAEVDV